MLAPPSSLRETHRPSVAPAATASRAKGRKSTARADIQVAPSKSARGRRPFTPNEETAALIVHPLRAAILRLLLEHPGPPPSDPTALVPFHRTVLLWQYARPEAVAGRPVFQKAMLARRIESSGSDTTEAWSPRKNLVFPSGNDSTADRAQLARVKDNILSLQEHGLLATVEQAFIREYLPATIPKGKEPKQLPPIIEEIVYVPMEFHALIKAVLDSVEDLEKRSRAARTATLERKAAKRQSRKLEHQEGAT